MAKTAAQRQKEYRERKKRSDPDYLRRERDRAKSNRKALSSLSRKEQETRRERNRYYAMKFRQKQKINKNVNITISNNTEESSISDNTVTSTTCIQEPRSCRSKDSQLLVRMTFPKKHRPSKALVKARNEIQILKKSINIHQTNVARWKKRYQRTKAAMNKRQSKDANNNESESCDKNQSVSKNPQSSENLTPRSKTKLELQQIRATPQTRRFVRRKLLLANVLTAEVQETRKENKDERRKKLLTRIVSGKIVKKYRCSKSLQIETGLSRNNVQARLINASKRIDFVPKRNPKSKSLKLKAKVVEFLERDDVSTQLPGKKDATKQDKEKFQTRVLSDYLVNIFEKFRTDNPDTKISFSLFCRLRPKYIKLTSCISRNTCLCTKHQNISMKLKCMKNCNIQITQSAESASKSVTLDDMKCMLNELEDGKLVDYTEWKRVEVDGKKKMKIIKVQKSKEEFTETMVNEYEQFLNHAARVKTQYSALRILKSNLPDTHLVIQMDFAENFTCGAMNEIQSAYFNPTSVTLHPVVIYHKQNGDVTHKNFIFVSDVLHHNATAVLTILEKLIEDLKCMFPQADTIHFWTDSPSSQYRNKYIFHELMQFVSLYGFKARWNYFESGHGKGPCDGLGGTAKRQACDAVKQGKSCIQDAADFFTWATENQKSINYRFYTHDDYEKTAARISEMNAKPIPGTMKLHAAVVVDGDIYTAETSCYCKDCLIGEKSSLCQQWTCKTNEGAKQCHAVDLPGQEINQDRLSETTQVGMFVAAIYEKQWYIGRIEEVDQSDETFHITFMTEAKTKQSVKCFQWPRRDDKLWLDISNVLCTITEPLPTGKSRRQFTIPQQDLDKIERLFQTSVM